MKEISDGSSEPEQRHVRPPIAGTRLEELSIDEFSKEVDRVYKMYQDNGFTLTREQVEANLSDERRYQSQVTDGITRVFQPDEPWNATE